jgi:hypothetical protein
MNLPIMKNYPLLVVVFALLQGAVTASCCHMCPPPKQPEQPFNAADLTGATELVQAGGEWTPDRAKKFRQLYDRLPGEQRFEVVRQLVSALNSKAITVPNGENPFLLGLGSPGTSCPSNCGQRTPGK